MIKRSTDFTSLSIAFFSRSGPDALAVLRLLGPADLAGAKVIYGLESGTFNMNAVGESDIVFLQRDIAKFHDSYEEIIELAHRHNKPVVFDLDDLLIGLPKDHPDRISGDFTEALLPVLQAVIEADIVTVATRTLKDYLLPYNPNIKVIPNYLNDRFWQFTNTGLPSENHRTITIGYMGGHSHRPDLAMLLPALKSILEKYPQRINFHFWGIEPPQELMPYSEVDWFPPTSYNYQDFVNYFQTQEADIVIAPLQENLFNTCKSPIKYFEYSANGMPGVYSNIQPYSEVVSDGEDGFLASSISEWVEKLSLLIEDVDLRNKFVLQSQRNIKKEWLLSENYRDQFRLYQSISSNSSKSRKAHHPGLEIIRSLSSQYYETFEKNRAVLLDLHTENAELDQKVEVLTRQSEDNLKVIRLQQAQLFENLESINSLTHQVEENQAKLDYLSNLAEKVESEKQSLAQQVSEQKAVITNLENKNNDLTYEVVSYSASKSWKYTRPFRRIVAFVRKVFR